MTAAARAASPCLPKPWEFRRPVQWLSLKLPCPPSANALTFNNPGKGRSKTAVYDRWIKDAGWMINLAAPGCVRGPYALTIRVRRARLRKDLGNVEKALSDLLVKMGVIQDDSLAESIDIAWADEGEGVTVRVTATKGEAA